MSVNGKFSEITISDLKKFADGYEVPDVKGIITQVQDSVSNWKQYAAASSLSDKRTDEIARMHRGLAHEVR